MHRPFRHSLNAANQFEVEHLIKSLMDPYAKPKERKVGAHRPKIRHLPHATAPRTRRERLAEKEAVSAQRRAIKKSARRYLKQRLFEELEGE